MKILLLNGPNLNMTGRREPLIYGTETFEKILDGLIPQFPELTVVYRQSNLEGELITWIQEAESEKFQGIIVNPGALAHYSLALSDALMCTTLPKLEVHLSNIHGREDFRRISVTAGACHGIISGLGKESYRLALEWMKRHGARPTGFQTGS